METLQQMNAVTDESPGGAPGHLLIPLRVHAASQEEGGRLTDELQALVEEMALPGWLSWERQRPDPGSQEPGVLAITVTHVLAMPRLVRDLGAFRRRHGVAVSVSAGAPDGIAGAPVAASPASPGAAGSPALLDLLHRIQPLWQVLYNTLNGQDRAPGAQDDVPPPAPEPPAGEDADQVPLSGEQLQVLCRMVDAWEHVGKELMRVSAERDLLRQELEQAHAQAYQSLREYIRHGDTALQLDDPGGALEVYKRALELGDRLAPDSVTGLRESAVLGLKLGTLKVAANPRRDRRTYLTRALQCAVKLEQSGALAVEDQELPRLLRRALQSLP